MSDSGYNNASQGASERRLADVHHPNFPREHDITLIEWAIFLEEKFVSTVVLLYVAIARVDCAKGRNGFHNEVQ